MHNTLLHYNHIFMEEKDLAAAAEAIRLPELQSGK